LLPAQVLAAGSDVYVGTITATTTKNNANTTTPFTMPKYGAVQCDVATYLCMGSSSSATCTAAAGELLDANSIFDIDATPTYRYLAILPVTGTANCKVFERKTK